MWKQFISQLKTQSQPQITEEQDDTTSISTISSEDSVDSMKQSYNHINRQNRLRKKRLQELKLKEQQIRQQRYQEQKQRENNLNKFEQLFQTHNDHFLTRLLNEKTQELYGHTLFSKKTVLSSSSENNNDNEEENIEDYLKQQKKKIFSQKRSSKIINSQQQHQKYHFQIPNQQNTTNYNYKEKPNKPSLDLSSINMESSLPYIPHSQNQIKDQNNINKNNFSQENRYSLQYIPLKRHTRKINTVQPIRPRYKECSLTLSTNRTLNSSSIPSIPQTTSNATIRAKQDTIFKKEVVTPVKTQKYLNFLKLKNDNPYIQQHEKNLKETLKQIKKKEKEEQKMFSKQEKKIQFYNKWKKEQQIQQIKEQKLLSMHTLQDNIWNTTKNRIVQFMLQKYQQQNQNSNNNNKSNLFLDENHLQQQIQNLNYMNIQELKTRERQLGIHKSYSLYLNGNDIQKLKL